MKQIFLLSIMKDITLALKNQFSRYLLSYCYQQTLPELNRNGQCERFQTWVVLRKIAIECPQSAVFRHWIPFGHPPFAEQAPPELIPVRSNAKRNLISSETFYDEQIPHECQEDIELVPIKDTVNASYYRFNFDSLTFLIWYDKKAKKHHCEYAHFDNMRAINVMNSLR